MWLKAIFELPWNSDFFFITICMPIQSSAAATLKRTSSIGFCSEGRKWQTRRDFDMVNVKFYKDYICELSFEGWNVPLTWPC